MFRWPRPLGLSISGVRLSFHKHPLPLTFLNSASDPIFKFKDVSLHQPMGGRIMFDIQDDCGHARPESRQRLRRNPTVPPRRALEKILGELFFNRSCARPTGRSLVGRGKENRGMLLCQATAELQPFIILWEIPRP